MNYDHVQEYLYRNLATNFPNYTDFPSKIQLQKLPTNN